MGDITKIEWTDATWNPVTGCTKVSQGCKHCYAERDWARMVHLPAYQGRKFTDVACHPERLDKPLRWMKPRRIFVNSMSDLFHESVPDEFIDRVFAVMALAKQHKFQVLTKRPERMLAYLGSSDKRDEWASCGDAIARTMDLRRYVRLSHDGEPGNIVSVFSRWPLPNVWIGASVEDQAAADERIQMLLQTPAAVRWISAEPLLGPIDLSRWVFDREKAISDCMNGPSACNWDQADSVVPYPLDWVVAGGESGPKARPTHPDWFRSLRDRCKSAGVPFLFKQWGEWISADQDECPVGGPSSRWMWADGAPWNLQDGQRAMSLFCRAGKKSAGRLLDGMLHDEYPEDAK